MTPAVANLALAKGTAYDVALVIQDAAAQPIDLAGFTLEASIRAASDTGPVDLAVIVTDAAAGLATVRIPAQPLGMGAWELWMQAAPETPRERALRGLVTVSETVDPREKENPSSHRLIVRVSDTVTVIVDAVDLAWWAYTRAVKAQLETASLAATWPQTVSNGEQAVNTAKNDALDALQNKQADAVLAVGRAQKTATDKIAGAQTAAVAAVQEAEEEAQGTITPLVQCAETAKEAIDQAEGRINTAATNAATSATESANSATAAQQALEAIPQVDDAGNMTLSGGLTAAGAINANGGINIPQAVGAPTDTGAVNRLYASGLAAVTEAFSPQSFLSDFNLYGERVAVEQTVPGQVWRLRKMSADPGTIQINLINPFLGVSNYSGWHGFVLPVALGNTGSTSARKLTFALGKPGNVVKKTAAEMDMFTLSPVSGSTASFPRFIDVTFYMVNDTSMNPAGYPVRVRELVYDSAQAKWLCYETLSVFPSTNTNPSCNMFLSYQQDRTGRDVRAGLWIGSNAADSRRLLCIADMHGVVDTYSWTGVGALYWDSDGTNSHSYLGAMRQMTAPGYSQPNGAYAAFRALETRLIQSTSTYDFTPYE